ncbi:MAG: class II aldolase/adducin family protein [Lautropia sp.]
MTVAWSPAERSQRQQLAASHRLVAHLGLEDLTYNHITARVPGEETFLVKPMGHMFREVTASNLEKYRLDGEPLMAGAPRPHDALLVLHASVMRARPEIDCVIHTHSVANVAVSSLDCGLLPMSQHALTLYGQIGYHTFGGYEFDIAMRESVVRDLGDHSVLVLRNHGVLVVGRSIGEAYVRHHFYEMACRTQLAAAAAAAAAGCKIVVPSEAVRQHAAAQVASTMARDAGYKDWPACLRLAESLYPDYRS